jgi:hypothetical protein
MVHRQGGVYAPCNGFFKIVRIPNHSIVAPDGRTIGTPLYCYFDAKNYNDFLAEEILIEARKMRYEESINGFTYSNLEEGDILEVSNFGIINDHYVYKWEVINR